MKNEAEQLLQQLGVAVCGGYVSDHVAVFRVGSFHSKTGTKVDGISSESEVFYHQLLKEQFEYGCQEGTAEYT